MSPTLSQRHRAPVAPREAFTTDGRSNSAWRGNELFHTPGSGATQLFFRTISAREGLVEFGREQLLPAPAFLTFGNGYTFLRCHFRRQAIPSGLTGH